jgi:hypothetical protein
VNNFLRMRHGQKRLRGNNKNICNPIGKKHTREKTTIFCIFLCIFRSRSENIKNKILYEPPFSCDSQDDRSRLLRRRCWYRQCRNEEEFPSYQISCNDTNDMGMCLAIQMLCSMNLWIHRYYACRDKEEFGRGEWR